MHEPPPPPRRIEPLDVALTGVLLVVLVITTASTLSLRGGESSGTGSSSTRTQVASR
jgi:hypothetical protein